METASSSCVRGSNNGTYDRDVAEVLAVERTQPVVFEHVAAGFRERTGDEFRVGLLGHRVHALVLIVDEEPAERLERSRLAQAREHRHRHMLADHRGILPEVVEDQRPQSEETLAGGVAVELDEQPRLDWIRASGTARPDSGIANPRAPPEQVSRVVRAVLVVLTQLLKVPRVHEQPDLLQHCGVEQLGGRLGEKGMNAGGRQQDDEQERHANEGQTAWVTFVPQSLSCTLKTWLQMPGCDGTGPRTGLVNTSRMRFPGP